MSDDLTNQCAELQPQLAAYALGDREVDASALSHVAACPACQQDLRDYRQVAQLLPYSAPEATPSPALRGRILAAIEAPARPQPLPAAPPRKRLRSAVFRPAVAFAVAAWLALFGWNISLQLQVNSQSAQMSANRENWQQVIVLMNDPDLRWYTVAGDGMRGQFWATPQGRVACLMTQGLPTLASDQTFQVWLLRGDERTSGGMFEASDGKGWILINTDEALANYDAIGVTIEPRGGSRAPTGPRVLSGSLTNSQASLLSDRESALLLLTHAAQRHD